MRGKKVLITGGCGFLGQYLTRDLLKEFSSIKIRILDLKANPASLFDFSKNKNVEIKLNKDITNYNSIKDEFKDIDTVIHLDRNNWNSEEMKQRTARAWRQGQNNAVEEYTIDSVFDDSIDNSESDPTLDQVKRLYQNMDASVFNRIIKESQKTDISTEYLEMRPQHASLRGVNEENLQIALSPYANRSVVPK